MFVAYLILMYSNQLSERSNEQSCKYHNKTDLQEINSKASKKICTLKCEYEGFVTVS